jgi:hypothetical protein
LKNALDLLSEVEFSEQADKTIKKLITPISTKFHRMLNKTLLTLVGILCFTFSVNSQSKTLVGIKLDASSAVHGFLKTDPSVSLTLNRVYGEHHGFETGLVYFLERYQFSFPQLTSYSNYFKIRRHYLTLPLSYKFYSSKLCFSAGMTINQYIGWTSKESDNIESYSSNEYDTSVGLLFTVSKQFKLSDRDLLEPTIFFHPLMDNYMKLFAGIGIAYKFQVGK